MCRLEESMYKEIKKSRKTVLIEHLKKSVRLNDINLIRLIFDQDINIKEEILWKCIEDAAHYARVEVLELILQKSKFFRYRPEEDHSELHQWLRQNIEKGRRGERVGWSCGPDSAPWPSSDVEDYIRVLKILNKRITCVL